APDTARCDCSGGVTVSTALRVGIVCYPSLGGSGVVATELGKSLARLGSEEYPLFGQYTPYALSLAAKIREVAEQYSLDLVHVHYAIPHATSAFLAKEM